MENTSQPLAVLYGYTKRQGKITFVGKHSDITLEMRQYRSRLISILSLCNGKNTVETIRKKHADLAPSDFDALIKLAEELGLIMDSRDLYLDFHKQSSNPMRYFRKMSPKEAMLLADARPVISKQNSDIMLSNETSYIGNLIRLRKTVRSFTDEPITLDCLSGLLQVMYTVNTYRSVPSAGQLYPLDIYVVVLKKSNGLDKGLYRYDPEYLFLQKIQDPIITQDVIARMLDGYVAEYAGAVIFITADLERVAEKYANRGYRYALIEAGHVAQNAYLYCAEHTAYGVVEYGGFQDELVADFLGLSYPKHAPLLALVVGRKGKIVHEKPSLMQLAWDLREQLVGKNKPIEYIVFNTPTHGGYKLPHVQVLAKYRQGKEIPRVLDDKDCFGSGFATTTDEAQIKALAEAYERYASGIYREDIISPANSLSRSDWVDPRIVVPVRPFAYRRHGWAKFDPRKKWQWVAGNRYSSNKKIFVPVDLVFYPILQQQVGRKLCYAASSNGVAAHFDRTLAVEKALLELIERDAISVTWYAKKEVCSIPNRLLPDDLRYRLEHWLLHGWNIKFLDLTMDSVPVIVVILFSEKRQPCFVAGAAAHPNLEAALNKAWDEAELFLMNWLRKKIKQVTPNRVYSPLDHGLLYFDRKNLSQVKWLIEAKELKDLPQYNKTMDDAFAKFDPIVLDLGDKDPPCDLHVVRVLSEMLLPINFGYGNEHIEHNRLDNLGYIWNRKFPAFPHFFA